MGLSGLPARPPGAESAGWAHLAFTVGSEVSGDALTERLRAAGFEVIDGTRRTGDGYNESVALDPEAKRIEVTV